MNRDMKTARVFRTMRWFVPLVVLAGTSPVWAQADSNRLRSETSVVVSGTVQGVFRSRDESVVQILVRRSEVGETGMTAGVRYPAPGENVYAHVDARETRFARRGDPVLPQVGRRIVAELAMGRRGQWVGRGESWVRSDERREDAALPPRESDPVRPARDPLGVSSEVAFVGGQRALKVTSVVRGSEAEKAGIEKGDILLQANGIELSEQGQLDAAFRGGNGPFALTVRNVRTGRNANVVIERGDAVPDNPRGNDGILPLGITAEVAFYDGEAALKVIRVSDGGAANRAGITPGLLILEIDGRRVESVDQMRAAEAAAGRRVEMRIVDPRERRPRTVRALR